MLVDKKLFSVDLSLTCACIEILTTLFFLLERFLERIILTVQSPPTVSCFIYFLGIQHKHFYNDLSAVLYFDLWKVILREKLRKDKKGDFLK